MLITLLFIYSCQKIAIYGGGGAYARDKNTSARLCIKNVGGACLRDTKVIQHFHD